MQGELNVQIVYWATRKPEWPYSIDLEGRNPIIWRSGGSICTHRMRRLRRRIKGMSLLYDYLRQSEEINKAGLNYSINSSPRDEFHSFHKHFLQLSNSTRVCSFLRWTRLDHSSLSAKMDSWFAVKNYSLRAALSVSTKLAEEQLHMNSVVSMGHGTSHSIYYCWIRS